MAKAVEPVSRVDMGWKKQARGFGACISYVLVLFASILAFDFEPSNNSERILPSAAYALTIDENVGDPDPDDPFRPVETRPVVSQRFSPYRLDIPLSDVSPVRPLRAYQFHARAPPVAA
jgi:hypothetical protein